jgi:hypothetical protein
MRKAGEKKGAPGWQAKTKRRNSIRTEWSFPKSNYEFLMPAAKLQSP